MVSTVAGFGLASVAVEVVCPALAYLCHGSPVLRPPEGNRRETLRGPAYAISSLLYCCVTFGYRVCHIQTSLSQAQLSG